MNFQRLKFYLHRLKRSSLAEIGHRFSDYLFIKRLKANPDFYKKDLAFDLGKTANNNLIFPKISSSVNIDTITQLLDGKECILGEDTALLQKFANKWKESHFSEVSQKKSDPDIRAVWEPARLQHLMILLQHLSVDSDFYTHKSIQNYVHGRLFEWLTLNPFLYGPHYMSVMECGLRIPVFVNALHNLKQLTDRERDKLLLAIFQHGWLIRNRLSLYSSLGNHTVAECVGLVMAGALFLRDKQGEEWLKVGIGLLEEECRHQILADGGPAEQSFAYHRFVLDLYWLAIAFLTDNGLHDCLEMKQRVIKGEEFLQLIQQKNESLPMIGDGDDGVALGRGLSPIRDMESICNTSRIFTSFPQSGYFLFRNQNGLRVLFDHGPLGMQPLNNHGHADGLSLFISVGDKDFLVDPGTFQYNGAPALRRYFKSTCAHNTVCINKRDQANQLTGFLWERSFSIDWRHEIDGEGQHKVTARHDGYMQQKIPVTHIRTVFCSNDGTLTIEDFFEGSGSHEYALHFHLHPSVIVERRENQLHLRNGAIGMVIDINVESVNLLHGQQNPIAGWYSPSYGEKVATTTIQALKNGTPENARFTTHIKITT